MDRTDLLHFSKEARDFVLGLLADGWTGRLTANQHAMLTHTASGKTATLGPNTEGRALRNAKAQVARVLREHDQKEEEMARPKSIWPEPHLETAVGALLLGWDMEASPQVMRFSRPDRAKQVSVRPGDPTDDNSLRGVRRQLVKGITTPEVVSIFAAGDGDVIPAEHRWAVDLTQQVADGEKVTHRLKRHEEQPEQVTHVRPERTVVSTAPWLARKGPRRSGGTRYESNAVLQRTYSDGSYDYLCAHDGCDFTADSARSVANHYGGSHGRKEPHQQPAATIIDPTYTEPLTHRPYRPSDRLVDALTEWLEQSRTEYDTERDLAVAALTWMHDRPDLPDPEPKEPLTDSEILARVRRLVDTGAIAEQERETARLRQQLQEVTDLLHGQDARILELDAALEASEAQRREAKEALEALAELSLALIGPE